MKRRIAWVRLSPSRPKAGEGVDYVTCRLCRRSYQAVNWAHLHFKHHLGGEDAVEEYKAEFGLSRVIAREVVERIAERKRIWIPEEIPALLADMKARGEDLSHSGVRQRYPGLIVAIQRHCGSWRRALMSAGIQPAEVSRLPKWTRGRVRSEIRNRIERGVGVNAQAVKGTLHEAACRLFGSWDRALRSAGVNPCKVRLCRAWTKETVTLAIRREFKAGRGLWYQAVYERDVGLLEAARSRFGSWKRAIRAAGLDPRLVSQPPPRSPAEEEVRRLILDRAGKGKPLYWDSIPPAFQHAGRKHFGSWRAALEACGIDADQVRRVKPWTEERLRKTILERSARGEPLNSEAVTRVNGAIVAAGRRFFGSWEAAILTCGLDYDAIRRLRPWTRRRARSMILLRKAKGLPLNAVAVQKEQNLLYAMAVKVYVSWDAALKASGVEPESVHVLRQWTEGRIRTAIMERSTSGKSLRRADVLREDSGLMFAAVRRYGQWNKAVESCGLEPLARWFK